MLIVLRLMLEPFMKLEKEESELVNSFKKNFCSRIIDEHAFINILTQRSIPQLLTINSAYAQITGHSLEKGIAKETSGNFKKAMIVLLTPREEYYANQIHEAVDGAGTKDKVFLF